MTLVSLEDPNVFVLKINKVNWGPYLINQKLMIWDLLFLFQSINS